MMAFSAASVPFLVVALAGVGCATGGGTADPASSDHVQRPRIERSDDLPRHTYAVTSTAALMEDAAAFTALAEKLEGDLRSDLAAYEIRDRATLKAYYETLGKLALHRGDDTEALAWFDNVRAVEDKPALRLTGALVERTLIEARRGAGGGRTNEMRTREVLSRAADSWWPRPPRFCVF